LGARARSIFDLRWVSDEGSVRTLPDGSSPELPAKEPTGVVGVTAGRSTAEEAFRPRHPPGVVPLFVHDLAGGEPEAEALASEARPEAG
jgi:hypothetical protein